MHKKQGLQKFACWLLVASIPPARHFVVLDQPVEFAQAPGGFLDSL